MSWTTNATSPKNRPEKFLTFSNWRMFSWPKEFNGMLWSLGTQGRNWIHRAFMLFLTINLPLSIPATDWQDVLRWRLACLGIKEELTFSLLALADICGRLSGAKQKFWKLRFWKLSRGLLSLSYRSLQFNVVSLIALRRFRNLLLLFYMSSLSKGNPHLKRTGMKTPLQHTAHKKKIISEMQRFPTAPR